MRESQNNDELEPLNTNMLVHAYIDTNDIFNTCKGIVENQKPISIYKDKYYEELNYLTLFFGTPRHPSVSKHLSYQKVARWEICNRHAIL